MKILSASNDRYVSLADISFPTARLASARLNPIRPKPVRPSLFAQLLGCGALKRLVTRSSVDLPLVCDATVMSRR